MAIIGMIFGKIFSNVYVWLAILVAAIVAAGFFYFTWSQHELSSLRTEIGTAKQQITQQQAVITDMQVQAKRNAEATAEFNQSVQEIRNKNSELAKLFGKIQLGNAAAKNPSLVEKKVNTETKKFFDDVEAISRK